MFTPRTSRRRGVNPARGGAGCVCNGPTHSSAPLGAPAWSVTRAGVVWQADAVNTSATPSTACRHAQLTLALIVVIVDLVSSLFWLCPAPGSDSYRSVCKWARKATIEHGLYLPRAGRNWPAAIATERVTMVRVPASRGDKF